MWRKMSKVARVAALVVVMLAPVVGVVACDDGESGTVEAACHNQCTCLFEAMGVTSPTAADWQVCSDGCVREFEPRGLSGACLHCIGTSSCAAMEQCEMYCE